MSAAGARIPHCILTGALCVLCAFSGCGGRGKGPSRVLSREEAVDQARVTLRSELVPARGTLGDPIAWRLTASVTGGLVDSARIEPPARTLDLSASKPPTRRSEGGRQTWSRELTLRGFDLGPIELPRASLPVLVAGKIQTLEFPRDTLFVDSLTPQASGTVRPDRGPLDTPLRPVDWIVAAISALLFLALATFLIMVLIRGRRRARAPIPVAPDPPEAVLDRALTELEQSIEKHPRDVFYERLSGALRRYAESRTGIPAPDLTTMELDRELARRASVLEEGREELIDALRRADLAKFARFTDETSEARSMIRRARSLSGRLVT